MKLRILDIGGSGVKAALLTNITDKIENFQIKYYRNPSWENFTDWLNQNGLIDSALIGISCAGFIESTGIIKMFRVGKWTNKNLPSEINKYKRDAKVYILNDAESHLMAHYDLYKQPQMSISIGTSVGFAISDENGKIIRPSDKINFDIGGLKIPANASNNYVWWALGSNGLEELQKKLGERKGAKHFGYRLGAFLVGVCSVFRPRTVVLSGGITEKWWSEFKETMQNEFIQSKPDWLRQPDIIKSPFASKAALVGISKYVNLTVSKR